jgi:hypothetical protein
VPGKERLPGEALQDPDRSTTPSSKKRVTRNELVNILPATYLVRELIQPHRLSQGRGITGIDVICHRTEPDPDARVDIRLIHVRTQQIGVIAQSNQQLGEKWVAGVTGAAEIHVFDPVEELRQRGCPPGALRFQQK